MQAVGVVDAGAGDLIAVLAGALSDVGLGVPFDCPS